MSTAFLRHRPPGRWANTSIRSPQRLRPDPRFYPKMRAKRLCRRPSRADAKSKSIRESRKGGPGRNWPVFRARPALDAVLQNIKIPFRYFENSLVGRDVFL